MEKRLEKFSFAGASDPRVLEDIYKKFKEDPKAVDEGGLPFFQALNSRLPNPTKIPQRVRGQLRVLASPR